MMKRGRFESYHFDQFKICPNDNCRKVVGSPFRFCTFCGGNVQSEPSFPISELEKKAEHEDDVHRILGNLTPDEFMDGLERLFHERPLTEKQEAKKLFFQSHLMLYSRTDDSPRTN